MTPSPAVLPIETPMTGIGWPVVPHGRGALILSLLYQLEQSQWWPAETMAHHQLGQLSTLVEHTAATVAFYGPRLQETGWSPGPAR